MRGLARRYAISCKTTLFPGTAGHSPKRLIRNLVHLAPTLLVVRLGGLAVWEPEVSPIKSFNEYELSLH